MGSDSRIMGRSLHLRSTTSRGRWARRAWACCVVVATLSAAVSTARADDSGSGIGQSRALLLLITEHVEGEEETSPRYWWSQPGEPAWTKTDAVVRRQLGERDVDVVEPPDGTRLSRVYRRPDLSAENIAGLASVVGADRVLSGRVVYEPTRLSAPGLVGSRANADLQVLDVGGAEPEVLRSFEVVRSGWATDSSEARRQARKALGAAVGTLVGRVAAASSGPVGVEGREPHLVFRAVRRRRALERIREGLHGLEIVEGTQVAWMAEGLLAIEINPGRHDDWGRVDRAAEQLATEELTDMQIERRSRERGPVVEFDVELAPSFGEEGRRERGGSGE